MLRLPIFTAVIAVGAAIASAAVYAQTPFPNTVPEQQAQANFAGFTTADPGMVAEAQTLLLQLGLNPGQPDGVISAQTTDAVRQFQSQYNVPTSGLIDSVLLTQLRSTVSQRGGPSAPVTNPQFGPSQFGGQQFGGGVAPAPGQLAIATVPALVVEGTNQVPGVGTVPTGVVREAQVHLETLGFGPGPADGIIGQSTIQAILSFQSRIGMLPDGRLTPHLLQLLREVRGGGGLNITVTQGGGYQFGHGGFPQLEVLEIQRLLNYLGFYPGDIDGVYGPHSARAIVQYQKLAGLPVDGRISRELLESLRQANQLNQFAGPGVQGSTNSTPFIGALPPTPQTPVILGPGAGSSSTFGGAAVGQLGPAISQPPLPADDRFQLRGGLTADPNAALNPPRPTAPQPTPVIPPRQSGPGALVDLSRGTAGRDTTPAPAPAPSQSVPQQSSVQPQTSGQPIQLGSLADNLVADVGRQFDPSFDSSGPVAAPREVVTLEDLVRENPRLEGAISNDDGNATANDTASSLTLGPAGSTGSAAPGNLGVSVAEQQAAAESPYSQGLVVEVFRQTSIEPEEFLGKLFDTSPLPFGYDVFLNDRGVAEYQDAESITLKWSGALSILVSGSHVFSIEMTMLEDFNCDATLFVNGLQILRLAPSQAGVSRDDTVLNLADGLAPVQMRLTCSDPVPNNVVNVTFTAAAPGQRETLPLAGDRLFAKDPFR